MANHLADPTDFGNKPGDGPLRQGGRPGSVDSKERDLPSTMSPVRKRQQAALELVRDVWGGTQSVRDKTSTYLPKAPGEDPQAYLERLTRSVFFNAYRRTVESLVGLAMRKDPVLSDDVPAPIVEHWENIDNAGTHGDVFVRDLLQDDLIAGHGAILVDYPKVSPEQVEDGTQARLEVEGKLRPYWVPIKKDDILSHWTENENGHLVLTQVVIRECTYERAGRFLQQEVTRYRVITREGEGDDVRIVWELLRITKDNDVLVEDEGEYANQVEIPVAEIGSSGRRDVFDSDPPLLDLAYTNVAHYQMWSDYAYGIHMTNTPFVFGAGIDATDDRGDPIEFVIGANTTVLVSDPNAKMQYVAHDGSSLDATEKALENLKSDMGTLGLEMLAPQKRAAETATAKRMDKSASDSALAVTVRRLQDGIERALQFHARYMKLESGGSVELNRDFEGLLLEAPVMQAFAQLVNAGFPARPVLEALQRGGRISDEADLDALEMEWLAGIAAKEAQAELEAEDRAREMADELDDAA